MTFNKADSPDIFHAIYNETIQRHYMGQEDDTD